MKRVAIIAPLEESVPPKKYGGTERIVYELAHGMGAYGYQVDLYASGDSKKEPKNYTLYPTVLKHLRATNEYKDNIQMRDVRKLMVLSTIVEEINSRHYDIVHNNFGWRYLIFSHFVKAPVLTTHHGPLNVPYHNMVYFAHKDAYHVSISDNQRSELPQLNFVGTVYNGVDTDELPFAEMPKDDYMFFLARVSPEKGPIPAIHAAVRTEKKLIMASKIDIADKEFYDTKVRPIIDNKHIIMHGEVGPKEKVALLQNAKCLLVPIQWEEPFGLMFTESMSCGTPVITFARGSAPEIIVDGVTGFLVNESEALRRGNYITKKTGIDGLVEAIHHLYGLSDADYRQMRANNRKRVLEKFTIKKMVEGYLAVYEKILQEERKVKNR